MAGPGRKDTRGMTNKAEDMFKSILGGNIQPIAKTEFDKAKSNSSEAQQTFEEFREVKVLLKEYQELVNAGAPEAILQKFRDKLGLQKNGHEAQKSNMDKLAMIELAAETDDPDIKAAIMDMAFPEKANDPLTRLERIIRDRKKNKPEKEENMKDALLMEMMKYFRDKADTPGPSPLETFTEMLEAVNKLNETTGLKKKNGDDLSTLEGVVAAKKKLEELGVIESKSDKLELRKIDIEEKRVENEFKLAENAAKREFDKEVETMKIAKEAAEILGKSVTKILEGKTGGGNKQTRTSDKTPVMMYCTNPSCKYAEGKEQFEIANPDQLEDLKMTRKDGSEQTIKGRVFSCPNDRGGCKNQYILMEGHKVEQFETNIDPNSEKAEA